MSIFHGHYRDSSVSWSKGWSPAHLHEARRDRRDSKLNAAVNGDKHRFSRRLMILRLISSLQAEWPSAAALSVQETERTTRLAQTNTQVAHNSRQKCLTSRAKRRQKGQWKQAYPGSGKVNADRRCFPVPATSRDKHLLEILIQRLQMLLCL